MTALPEEVVGAEKRGEIPTDPAIDPNALLSIVVPLMNEAGTIRDLYDQVSRVLQEAGRRFEVVFVDDGSTDDSYEVLKALYLDNTEAVRVIKFRRNKGKAAALAAGFDLAEGDVIITLDADLQDDPAEIPRFLEALANGADMVTGWKKRRRDPWFKVASSRFFNFVVSLAAGLRLHDYNCGFKAYRREVIEEITLYGELHRYIPFLANARGFAVDEIVVQHHRRKSGRSKYGWGRYFRGFFDLFTVIMLTRFGRRPLHLFGSIGLVLFVVGLLINMWLTWIWLWGASIGQRPLLFLGVLLMVVGVQIFTIGLIGEMINSLNPQDKSDRPIRTILK
jgi:glycosyltransferase involved in cell wall biosynthesis